VELVPDTHRLLLMNCMLHEAQSSPTCFVASWSRRTRATNSSPRIRTTREHIGFIRTERNIQIAFKFTINAIIRHDLLKRSGQE